VITLEPDATSATGIRACAVRSGALRTSNETLALRYVSPRRLPPTLLPNHGVRIRDARARRARPFIR
jgi:hypothetical protein